MSIDQRVAQIRSTSTYMEHDLSPSIAYTGIHKKPKVNVDPSPWQPEACRMCGRCWVSHRWLCFCDTEQNDFSAFLCHRWEETRYT